MAISLHGDRAMRPTICEIRDDRQTSLKLGRLARQPERVVQLAVAHEGEVSPYEQEPIYKPRQINDEAGTVTPIAARGIGSACPKPKQHCFAIRLKHLSGFANGEEYSIAFRHDRGIGQPALEKVRDKVKLPRPARR
jgi:hypothetical protein